MTIRVGHVRRDAGEYIGRPMPGRKGSPLGNPFAIGRDGPRAYVLTRYRSWLVAHQYGGEVMAEIARLIELAHRPEGVTLLCWCAPEECHGDTVREAMEAIDAGRRFR